MNQEDDFSQHTVAVFGLGLMGGSLAMGLRGRCAKLIGIDPDPQARRLALELGVVDEAFPEAVGPRSQADVVILAAPVRIIIDLLHALPEIHQGEPVVLDLGSTKRAIVAAMAELPARFDPIGGHPMCGKEKASIAYADPQIFYGAPFALTPLPRSTARARSIALALVHILQAAPLWIDAETHDRWVASTSHLPYLVSSALATAVPVDAAPLVGTGFRSASRLAATSPTMMLDVLATNREVVLEAVAAFRNRIELLEALLQNPEKEDELRQELLTGVDARLHLVPPSGE